MAKKWNPAEGLLALLLLICGGGMVLADENKEEPKAVGQSFLKGGLGFFELNIDLDFNAFEWEKNTLSDIELRKWKGSTSYPGNFRGERITWPISGTNWNGDTNVFLTYDAGILGGTLGLCVEGPKADVGDSYHVKASTIRGWLKPVKYFKATAGVDIGSDYADALGADPGLRIYDGTTQKEWAHTRKTDDILQDPDDNGVLLEGFFGPVTLALAGRYYESNVFSITVPGSQTPGTQDGPTTFEYVDQAKFSAGARIGSTIGEWGKADAAYLIEYNNYGEGASNQYVLDNNNKAVPGGALAEVTRHLFGVFASLTPFRDFGVTAGYNGIVTTYTPEFYRAGWQKTTMPVVYQQGFNLNLRYQGIPKWTFRTDNCVSFWNDKNYWIFDVPGDKDKGILPDISGKDFADVNHLVIWNGLGVKYQITKTWRSELYLRNLLRRDSAAESAGFKGLVFSRDEMFAELKGIWKPTEYCEFYAGIEVKNQITTLNNEVNKLTTTGDSNNTGFKTGVEPRDTVDSVLTVKIPMGMTIWIR